MRKKNPNKGSSGTDQSKEESFGEGRNLRGRCRYSTGRERNNF